MKKLVLLGLFLFIGVTLTAQNKNAKAIIEVNGVCLLNFLLPNTLQKQ